MPKIITEYIDMICNIQMLPGKGSLPRGCTKHFYDAARKKQKDPLTYLAAKALMERVKPDDVVIIATGARCEPILPFGETDGPIGAVALARSLDKALNAKTVITVEESNAAPTIACARASGVYVRDIQDFDKVPGACIIDYYPLGVEAGKKKAVELIDAYKPAAIIFIEKHGPNAKGELHSVTGRNIDKENMGNAYFLAYEAEKRGILTIGTGDGGNEIGNGLIYDEVREISPYGIKCQCPCGDGIATVVKTDIFVAASISNWGAYGICAALALLKEDVDIMHDTATERRMVEACAHYGSVDGISMRPEPRVDGISLEGGQAIVTLLREAVTNGLKSVDRHV